MVGGVWVDFGIIIILIWFWLGFLILVVRLIFGLVIFVIGLVSRVVFNCFNIVFVFFGFCGIKVIVVVNEIKEFGYKINFLIKVK